MNLTDNIPSDDLTDWIDELSPARTRLALERAARKYPYEVDFDDQGVPHVGSRSLLTDDEGYIIHGIANEDNFQYLLFQEYVQMYLQEIFSSLAQQGLLSNQVTPEGELAWHIPATVNSLLGDIY